jgi:hypothetical protein
MQATDASIRKLLGDLAQEERRHSAITETLEENLVSGKKCEEENRVQRRLFVLQVIQLGLAGLMDGSVSTLAPVFAAAFSTKSTIDAFLVGLAASVDAGISMGFADSLSDDGSLTGCGRPWIRGPVCGLMTALGGIGHAAISHPRFPHPDGRGVRCSCDRIGDHLSCRCSNRGLLAYRTLACIPVEVPGIRRQPVG